MLLPLRLSSGHGASQLVILRSGCFELLGEDGYLLLTLSLLLAVGVFEEILFDLELLHHFTDIRLQLLYLVAPLQTLIVLQGCSLLSQALA